MLSNQNINVKNPVSFSKQTVSQTQSSLSDEQTITDILEELEEQEKKDITQDQSVNLECTPKEVNTKKSVSPPVKQTRSAKPKSVGSFPEREKSYSEDFKKTPPPNGKSDEDFLDPLKKAKLEYEKLNQPEDEEKIIGVVAIEIYLNWIKKAHEILKNAGEKNHQKILDFLPKRLLNQIGEKAKTEKEDPEFIEKNHKDSKRLQTEKDKKLQERVQRIDERIKKLNQEKSEYLEELLPLESKKALIKEEGGYISGKILESGTVLIGKNEEGSREKLEQERSAQDLINKSSFQNEAPVVSPRKEENLRLKKALLAEEFEEEENEEIPPPKEPAQTKELGKNRVEKKTKTVSEEEKHFYTDEQLHAADTLRKEFWEKISSLPVSEWYQCPTKNRDFVNKEIIKLTKILSNKRPDQINMEDIQTARLFIFNKAPQKVLKHPAFSYIESFYNYQSFQGCIGTNPERTEDKQKDLPTKTNMSSMLELEANTNRNLSSKQALNKNPKKRDTHWDNTLLD